MSEGESDRIWDWIGVRGRDMQGFLSHHERLDFLSK